MHEMVFWNAGWLPVLLVSGVAFVVGVVLLARLVLQNKRREAPVARERSTVAQTAAPRRTVVDENIDQPPDPLPAQIGHYRIEKKLGRGAMGEVYLGRDGETGIPAAIKTHHELDTHEGWGHVGALVMRVGHRLAVKGV